MYALVDCNSFFCSVEKVFHPGLEGVPVCVLSSGDGCIVALTPEAKALGLRRGDPLFRVQHIVRAGGVRVFSGNMVLYAAMSRRVMQVLRRHIGAVETYSIDESFCDLRGHGSGEALVHFMHGVVDDVRRCTDIPVSAGIAPTKTLAKMASKFAKQYKGYRSVCLIDSEEKRLRALSLFPLADVWGIGPRTYAVLRAGGMDTALDFARQNGRWVRSRFALPVYRTWLELQGHPCIDTSEVARRGQICRSRSFGQMVNNLTNLSEAVARFATGCACSLRAEGSVAGSVTVFVSSNVYRTDLAQHQQADTATFQVPTADTLEIVRAALSVLRRMYRPGVWYKKAGVILSQIQAANPCQLDLFDPISRRPQRVALMRTIDALNDRFGLASVHTAIDMGKDSPWHARCDYRSPNYLTDLADILKVRI